jgi:hypothetical protein
MIMRQNYFFEFGLVRWPTQELDLAECRKHLVPPYPHVQHHPTTSATRGIGKSVHSPAELTQQALALCLKTHSRLSPNMRAGASARCHGIRHDRSRFGCGPAQVDDDPFERRQGQIPKRQVRRQTGTSDITWGTQANCPTIAMNAGEFEGAKQPDHHGL